MSLTNRIVTTHRLFPEWDSGKIARELGCSCEYVRAVASRRKLRLPRAVIKLTPRQQTEIADARDIKTRVLAQKYKVSYSRIYSLQRRSTDQTAREVFVRRDLNSAALARRDLTATLMGDPPPRT